VATGVLLVQFAMKGFGAAAEKLAWMKRLSLFTLYDPVKWVNLEAHYPGQGWAWALSGAQREFGPWGPLAHNAVLLGIGLAAYTAAAIVFLRRDLPAPL
jgi:ABC-2 type transport system permease protein